MADLQKLLYPPDQESYSVTDGTTVVATALDGGSSRYRADLLDAAAIVTVQWTLGPADFQFFKAFFRTALANGALPFLIDLYMDNAELTEHEVHIVPGTFKLASQQGNTFIITCNLEAIPNNTDATLNYYIILLTSIYGPNVTTALNLFQQIANFDLTGITTGNTPGGIVTPPTTPTPGDFGLVTDTASTTTDFGLVTDTSSSTTDYGTV